MKKNDHFIGTCYEYTNEGLGIVKYEGQVFFVTNILRGETAEIVCTLLKKNYGFGKAVKLLEVSEHRCEALCSCYKLCGGCHLQLMDIHEQQFFKTNKVRQCFKSIAHMNPEINDCKMGNSLRYRNKVQVPVQVDDSIKMGFYKNRTNEIVEFEDCLVQTVTSNELVQYLKKHLPIKEAKKLKHVLIKHAHHTGEVMLVLIVRERLNLDKSFMDNLLSDFGAIKTVVENINERKDNVILGEEEYVLYGDGIIQEELLGNRFNISSKSFYQINPEQTEVLYQCAIDKAQLKESDTLIDLYCGTGTIGIIASKYVKEVIGIEIVAEAIEDAKKNALANGRDNISFICADASKGANELIRRNIKPDVVIVDPPRKGLDDGTIDAIKVMSPERLVYVSCDPSTLARDVAKLQDSYELKEVQPVDMFPMTNHVETVVLMSKKA